jgi:hypothetical protein
MAKKAISGYDVHSDLYPLSDLLFLCLFLFSSFLYLTSISFHLLASGSYLPSLFLGFGFGHLCNGLRDYLHVVFVIVVPWEIMQRVCQA